jgi:Flp pilus assembly pilin Flp
VRLITSKLDFLLHRERTDARPRAVDYAVLIALMALACIAAVGTALR